MKRSEITIGAKGKHWIFTKRERTGTATRIPLLQPAQVIIDKYADHPQCSSSDLLLLVSSNQKMNAYLKEIADLCGIDKRLTFHMARHTFASTITSNNGVPIEIISSMLGHTDLKTTQHYAKILDIKIGSEMDKLALKLG